MHNGSSTESPDVASSDRILASKSKSTVCLCGRKPHWNGIKTSASSAHTDILFASILANHLDSIDKSTIPRYLSRSSIDPFCFQSKKTTPVVSDFPIKRFQSEAGVTHISRSTENTSFCASGPAHLSIPAVISSSPPAESFILPNSVKASSQLGGWCIVRRRSFPLSDSFCEICSKYPCARSKALKPGSFGLSPIF